MLIFRQKELDLVLSGKKTQTRRLWPHGPRVNPNTVQGVSCGRIGKARAHVRVLDVSRQRLGEVTTEEAIKEGFQSREGFLAYFEDQNGVCPNWTPVWTVTFELIKETE